MKRIVNIVLLLVVALHLHGCDFLAPFFLMELPRDENRDYHEVCFEIRSNSTENHYKIALYNEHKDSVVIDRYKNYYCCWTVVDVVDVREYNPFEQYKTPWHYAMDTYLGGVTRCEIYKMKLWRDTPLHSWEGIEGNEPICTFEIVDNKPNSFFKFENWEHYEISYSSSELNDGVIGHVYAFTIPEPSEAAEE
jgi:hypothetical protein